MTKNTVIQTWHTLFGTKALENLEVAAKKDNVA